MYTYLCVYRHAHTHICIHIIIIFVAIPMLILSIISKVIYIQKIRERERETENFFVSPCHGRTPDLLGTQETSHCSRDRCDPSQGSDDGSGDPGTQVVRVPASNLELVSNLGDYVFWKTLLQYMAAVFFHVE